MLVDVAIENTAFSFDMPFTYEVPSGVTVIPGMRVTVPFGQGNKTRIGMVLDYSNKEKDAKTKTIVEVLDEEPVLTKEMISLAIWMKSRYFCTLFDAVKLMLPAGISYKVQLKYSLNKDFNIQSELDTNLEDILSKFDKKKSYTAEQLLTLGVDINTKDFANLVKNGAILATDNAKRKAGDATEKMIFAVKDYEKKLSPKQTEVYEHLCSTGDISVKELMYYTGVGISVIKALSDKGAAIIYEKEVYRKPKYLKQSLEDEELNVSLSYEQALVFDDIIDEFESKSQHVSVLYGVTGSGKTSVFLKLIDYVIGKGLDAILMVPEIALTPQTIEIFKKKFGDNIAVFHSALSVGERMDQWKRVSRGECKLAIGTRSAVFAPFRNLGLIVIDEEQESTYKSEITPRYNAKEIAKFRAAFNKSYCLFSSATPSLESYHLGVTGKYGLHKLEKRFGKATLPSVRIVDMNNEVMFGNKTDISYPLTKALNDNLRNGKQSIILLNRRGYNTYASCKNCHTVIDCPNCSISLTMHSANNRLMCHYCGYSKEFSSICPKCNSDGVSYTGIGTQRAEESLIEAVPDARILRIDADSTMAKYSLEQKLDLFAKGNYDIMIGTQMVAKGLNFENVTLVGVLSADQSLYSDDFRSSEKAFDLLTQVVGRSGRGKFPGEAIIQTYVPENPYLKLAASQDYATFYDMEIAYRFAMLYPPYVDIIMIGFVGEDEARVKLSSEYFLYELSNIANQNKKQFPLRILRPSPAAVHKIGGKYRYKLIIKCKNTIEFRDVIADLLIKFAKNKDYKEVTAFADLNPSTIM